jgi:hypothetical protein
MEPQTLPSIPTEGVPKFLGGFLWGMTGQNNLQEIEACYNGGDLMYNEISMALADIKEDGWDPTVQAILEFGIVALQIPQVLKTCKGMGDDLNAIEEWASIFTDPAKLSATVAKHLALHRKQIKADIAADKAHWAAQEFWMAGVTTADLATTAIGPITPHYPTMEMYKAGLGFDAMTIPDFIAGLIFGFTGDNQLTEIESCYNGGETIVTDAEALAHDLTHGDFIKAIDDNAKFAQSLEDALQECTTLDGDIARIKAWGEIFTEPTKLAETVGKHWLLHKRHIKKEWEKEKQDWASEEWFTAGEDIADILVTLIGTVA